MISLLLVLMSRCLFFFFITTTKTTMATTIPVTANIITTTTTVMTADDGKDVPLEIDTSVEFSTELDPGFWSSGVVAGTIRNSVVVLLVAAVIVMMSLLAASLVVLSRGKVSGSGDAVADENGGVDVSTMVVADKGVNISEVAAVGAGHEFTSIE